MPSPTKPPPPADAISVLRRHAREIFDTAVAAVRPEACIKRMVSRRGTRLTLGHHEIDLDRIDNLYLIGAGKASAAMAVAREAILGDRITTGRICVKDGHGARARRRGRWATPRCGSCRS